MKKILTILSFCFAFSLLSFPSFADQKVLNVGEMQVEMLIDEFGEGDVSILQGASPEMIKEYIPTGKYPMKVASSLIKVSDQFILIDTGIDASRLGQHLKERSISPDEIKTILISHMHFDHIGGLIHEGKAFFPNATLYISEREQAYWADSTNISKFPEKDQQMMRQFFQDNQNILNEYKGRIVSFSPAGLMENAKELFPGINAIAAYGHTPGHTVFLLHSQGNKLLLLADTFHLSSIQFPHPEVTVTYDIDQKQAAETRRTIFDFAAFNAIPIAGMHQTNPEFGLIKQLSEKNGGYSLMPLIGSPNTRSKIITNKENDMSHLQWKLLTKKRDSSTQGLPPGKEDLAWVTGTVTLIYGEHDAVLVDTFLSEQQSRELLDWIIESGKNLTTIYITHAHGDHFFGLSTLLEHFPKAKVIATAPVVAEIKNQIKPEFIRTFWEPRFPGQLPSRFVVPDILDGNNFFLEGEALEIVALGHTDTSDSTALHVPSIGLLISGDGVYNNTHLYLAECDERARNEWLKALDTIESLHPKAVVAGHGVLDPDSSPRHIENTRQYLLDFNAVVKSSSTQAEVYEKMLALYPNRVNPGSLWAAAKAAKSK